MPETHTSSFSLAMLQMEADASWRRLKVCSMMWGNYLLWCFKPRLMVICTAYLEQPLSRQGN